MKKSISILLAFIMVMTMIPSMPYVYAEQSGDAVIGTVDPGYRITLTYPDDLCTVTMRDNETGALIESGGYVHEGPPYNLAYLILDISDIKEGYRIKSLYINGEDNSKDFITGSYGCISVCIRQNSNVEIEVEKIPDTLPEIKAVSLMYGTAILDSNSEVTFDKNARLEALFTFDNAGSVSYADCYYEYSQDGISWIECTNWGEGSVFMPGWSDHTFDFIYSDYYIRAHATGKENYSTGECYSEAIKVNAADLPSGNCGNDITWRISSDKMLTISGSGEMPDYRNLDAPWLEYKNLFEYVTVEDGITSISAYAFFMCDNVMAFYLPASLSSIDDSAFYYCSGIDKFSITYNNPYFSSGANGALFNKNKTKLIWYALGNSAESFKLPKTVTKINERAFSGAANLSEITVESGNTSFTSQDGVLYTADLKELVVFPAQSSNTTYQIPGGVEKIAAFAFEDCGNLNWVSMPDSLLEIGALAFAGSKINRVKIPDSVTTVEHQAFYGCEYLANVELSANMTAIPGECFASCPKLEEITIPDKVTEIENQAFDGCFSLKKVYIPKTVTAIEDLAFSGCDNLTIYGYAGSYAQIYANEYDIPFVPMSNPSGGGGGISVPEGKQAVSGVLTFPEDAFIEGGEIIINIWVRGQYSDDYLKQQFIVSNTNDIPFTFIMDKMASGVNLRVGISNLSGAYTNIHSNIDFVYTLDGMAPDIYPYPPTHYISVDNFSETQFVIPTGKIVSGKISGTNLKVVDGEVLTLWFGNKFTRARINPETFEYKTVLPYGVENGTWSVYLEKGVEGAASNILPGKYYPVSGESVTIPDTGKLTNLNFNVSTGYAISGNISIPDDAVLNNFEVYCELNFNGKTYYVTGLTTKEGFNENNRIIPYMIGIPNDTANLISSDISLTVRGYIRDDMLNNKYYSNILSGVTYYHTGSGTSFNKDDAKTYSITGDVTNVDFELQTGCAVTVNVYPEETGVVSYLFRVVDENGKKIAEISDRAINPENQETVVVPKEYLGKNVYYMYKVDYDSYGEYPDIYTGKAYLKQGGKVVGFRHEATQYKLEAENTVDIHFAEDEDVTLPAVATYNGEPLETAHPYESRATEYLYYSYDGTKNVTELNVTFSPKSWFYEYADVEVTINDGHSRSKTYSYEEFTELVSGEKLNLKGSKFEIYFITPYISSYSQDYGLAILDIEDQNGISLITGNGGSGGDSGDSEQGGIYGDDPANSNTIFNVADTSTLNAIAGAEIYIESEDGQITKHFKTNSQGKITANLPNGIYNVSAWKNGYEARKMIIDKTEQNSEYTIYLSSSSLLDVKTTVKEMSYDDMIAAGIDPDAPGNKHVYEATAVLKFERDIEIKYYYTTDGVIKADPVKSDNKTIYVADKDIYLIVHSNVTWLKEMFDVQLVVANTSAIENVKDCVANITLPDGLSLADMIEGSQSLTQNMGDIAPGGSSQTHWYIRGDKKGEYYINGTVDATRVGGGITSPVQVSFKTQDPITVYAGDAMKLVIEAEKTAVTGKPYRISYTLQNVVSKPLYNVELNVLGGKFYTEYSVSDLKYDPNASYGGTFSGDAISGYKISASEFAPGAILSGVFEITFAQGIDIEDDIRYMLTDMFVITGSGSTTTIPTEIKLVDKIVKHNWDDGVVVKDATCTSDGERKYTCSEPECPETKTVVIPALGHDLSGWNRTKNPTCTDSGKECRNCSRCEYEETRTVNALGHDWEGSQSVDKEPTCTANGEKSVHCTRCTATKDKESIDKLGHNYGSWQVRTPAQCTKDGLEYAVCSRCSDEKTQAIPMLGHNYGSWQVRTPAQCTKDGLEYAVCSRCSDEKTQAIPALGHNWETSPIVDVEPTCTANGEKSIHCTRCTATKDKESIDKLGHNYGEWKVRKAATCTSDGIEYRVCSRGDNEETRSVAAKGHSWNNGVITKYPTETETGIKLFTCSACSETKTEVLSKLVYQDVGFITGDLTYTYGSRKEIHNSAYNDSKNGSALTYSSSNTSVATVDSKGKVTIISAGETTITATAAANAEYLATSASYKLTIKKAPLTITAKDAEITYGEVAINNGYKAEGFVFDDNQVALKGEPVYDINYNQYQDAGEYVISVSGIDAQNYEITFVPGKLTVKKTTEYKIELSGLTQRKDKVTGVTCTITPKDSTAVIKVEYKINGVWTLTLPNEIGEYEVRASLAQSNNIVVPDTAVYTEAMFNVKAGAVIDIDGTKIDIETVTDENNNVEFVIDDDDVQQVINNVPATGEVVIDGTGSTEGVNNLILPTNIIDALDESEEVKKLTVIADDAEISMDTDVIKTVADEMETTDKLSIHIDAVEKDKLNNQQQEALNAIANDAVILQLNLVVTKYDEQGNELGKELHALNGNVAVRAAYTLPESMEGKKVVVCYVSNDGSVTYIRAEYSDGYVSFNTDHFSHYAITAMACPHVWDQGTVVRVPTSSYTGIKIYKCTLCDEEQTQIIPALSGGGGSSGGGGGGGGGAASKVTYTVSFNTNGGNKIADVTVEKNKNLTKPADPKKDGFKFDGWYTDETLSKKYDFSASVSQNFVLYAAWIADYLYDDVKSDDWFYDAVKYAKENGLMNGTSDKTFSPSDKLTRAMLVTVLYRNEGEPEVNTNAKFADVNSGSYYEKAVSWAQENGIVNGVSDKEFAPDSFITREQIAAIMYRFAKYKGYDVSFADKTDISNYKDSNEVSDYATKSVSYASGSGLMNGKTNSTFNPKDNATRAEIAVILQRFIKANN